MRDEKGPNGIKKENCLTGEEQKKNPRKLE